VTKILGGNSFTQNKKSVNQSVVTAPQRSASGIKVLLTHRERNKAMFIHNYIGIFIQSCQLVGFVMIFSC
jgi:hypothetical protein